MQFIRNPWNVPGEAAWSTGCSLGDSKGLSAPASSMYLDSSAAMTRHALRPDLALISTLTHSFWKYLASQASSQVHGYGASDLTSIAPPSAGSGGGAPSQQQSTAFRQRPLATVGTYEGRPGPCALALAWLHSVSAAPAGA
ncbi:uncharacterized protein TrAFT101_008914 [Trichoderma asperellum]|nr:hypothetical protein TrAFT101_008914 [Trichoderma asperellum]